MWRIILLLFIGINCFGQSLDSVKHIEIVSEVKDSMVLLNKQDVDKINSTYEEKRRLDTLSTVRREIIDSLSVENSKLELICSEQKAIISNSEQIQSELKQTNEILQGSYEKEKKKRQRDNIVWPATTGTAIICLLLILLI